MATGRASQFIVEVITGGAPYSARVSQDVVEVLIPTVAPSPTTPTGAGVTKDVVEVLMASVPRIVVTQDVVECLILDQTAINPGGVSTVSHGYAV